MTEQSQNSAAFSEPASNDMRDYKRFSPWAVASLIAGMASGLALVGPTLWWVGGCGLLVCTLAMIHYCRHRETLVGERLARTGLMLSLIFIAAAPTRYFVRQWEIQNQAETIGSEWITYLLMHQPYKASESLRMVESRRPLDLRLTELYRADKKEADIYRQFLNRPLIKTLGLLNGGQVRLYETEKIEPGPNGTELVTNVYAVTYYEDEPAAKGNNGEAQALRRRKKSFFVRLELERRDNPVSPSGLWRVVRYEGGVIPRTPPT